jgi:acyl dehydratase
MAETTNPRTAQVGDTLPTLSRETGFHNWNRYAAVNHEFVPIHMDDDAGRAAGYPTAFGMGNLQWSYLHNMLRNWLGDEGTIQKVAVQFRSPNVKGQVVTAHGTITAINDDGGAKVIDLEVWTDNQDGNKMGPGTATVRVNP